MDGYQGCFGVPLTLGVFKLCCDCIDMKAKWLKGDIDESIFSVIFCAINVPSTMWRSESVKGDCLMKVFVVQRSERFDQQRGIFKMA